MTDQVLDVRMWWRLVRRGWLVVLLCVVLGLSGAALYDFFQLPRYTASALVLLPSTVSAAAGTGTSKARPITTDARIATSAAVLAPAGREVDPSASVTQLQGRVTASGDAGDILRVSATGSTPTQAKALANAVASHFVGFVTTNGLATTASTIAGLQAEAKQLTTQLADVRQESDAVNRRITVEGPSSSAGLEDSALLTKLAGDESSLTLQLSSVKSQIAQAQLSQISNNEGVEVIEKALTAVPPSAGAYAIPLLVGAFAGFLLGSGIAVVRGRRDPRLRTRDALAQALAAPVVLSLPAPALHSASEWTELLERHDTGPLEQWSVRKALRELRVGEGESRGVTVVAFSDDASAIALGAILALATPALGSSTELAVVTATDATQDKIAGLRAACAQFSLQGASPRPGVHITSGTAAARDTSGLAVTILVVEPQDPVVAAEDMAGTIAVMSVSADHASAEQLARVAIAVNDRGTPIEGVLVANPGSEDQTTGRVAGEVGRASLDEYRRGIAAKQPNAAGRTR